MLPAHLFDEVVSDVGLLFVPLFSLFQPNRFHKVIEIKKQPKLKSNLLSIENAS